MLFKNMTLTLNQRGVSFVEILVNASIFVILAIAIINLASVGTRTAIDNQQRTLAIALINDRIEKIRNLPYSEVGYNETGLPPSEPDGSLVRQETVTQNGQQYTINTRIDLVDDPFNGTVQDLTEATADYKTVHIRLTWNGISDAVREVNTYTFVTPSASVTSPSPTP